MPTQLAAQPPAHTAPAAPTVAASAPSTALPTEAFAELPFLAHPILSPDGTRIAARLANGSHYQIGVWTLSEPRDHPPHLIDIDDAESFAWAGNSRVIINTVSFRILVRNETIAWGPSRQIYVHDLTSGKTTPVGDNHGLFEDVVFIDPYGRYLLLATQPNLESTPNVERVDLATGQAVEVQHRVPDVWTWFADSGGNVRVGVDYSDHRTRIYYRSAAEAALRHAEAQRDLRHGGAIDAVRFVTNTDRGVIVTNAANGRFGVYDYDFATDTRGAAIFEDPDVDVTSAIFGPDGGVDGVFYDDDRPRVRWFNPQMIALQQSIDRTFPGKTNIIVNRSLDGNRVLIFSSAADDPGTYYVFDRAARRMEAFASPYDGLQGHVFAPVQAVSYVDRAGVRIHAYLTLPPGRPAHGLPLIIHPHGGPFLRDTWEFDPEVQFLASRGYAVLQPNFRGSTGYGSAFVEQGYGQLGGAMIDDMEDGMDWLVGQGIADPARVCIMGESYGGYAAIWGAMRSPQRYRCAISLAGPTDLRAMIRYNANSFIPRRYVREFRSRIEGEEQTDLDAISPLRHPDMMRVPLLIAHGATDAVVPPRQSVDLLHALQRRQAVVESIFYAKSGHGFTDPSEAADYYRRVEAFLAAHNPSGSAPPTAASAEAPSAIASRTTQ